MREENGAHRWPTSEPCLEGSHIGVGQVSHFLSPERVKSKVRVISEKKPDYISWTRILSMKLPAAYKLKFLALYGRLIFSMQLPVLISIQYGIDRFLRNVSNPLQDYTISISEHFQLNSYL